MKNIKRLAIANRGEVAVRIIRACKELNIKSVLLHSEVDTSSLAYRLADETICIGKAPSAESYLSIENNIKAAVNKKCDALHPGFGFLSENADFAKACNDHNILFVGPPPESIDLFGNKMSAKALVEKTGVPVVPGYRGEKSDIKTIKKEVLKIGFPVLVKAASGGGGRGMKVIREEKEIEEMVDSAKREAKEAFGDERIFLEKYLEHPKHIEIQIFVDASGNVYHLYERECSVQRRHQKIVEEAPSASLSPKLREEMAQAAVKIAQEAKYKGAGTVEFLLQDGQFYFLEMNTRLQVEHPVSEMVTGLDLVQAQLLTADGQSLGWKQSDIQTKGHSIECRLYAEDAYKNGLPSVGEIIYQKFPKGKNYRFEYGFEAGDSVSPYYDSMIAKLIVTEDSREKAISSMLKLLGKTIVFGIKTNIPYLREILLHQDFKDASFTTKFIDTYFPSGIQPQELSAEDNKNLRFLFFDSSKKTLDEPISPWSEGWKI